MRYIYIISLVMFLTNCKPTKINIRIENNDFNKTFKNFTEISSQYIADKNNVISVAINIGKRDTTVTFYSYKKLKQNYFIGYTKIDAYDVFFYSNKNQSVNGFFEILSPPQVIDTVGDFSEAYNMTYTYKNGKFIR